jgi:hypothetical protein
VQVNQAYQAAKYRQATAMLPDLIRAADAYDGYQGRDGRETCPVLGLHRRSEVAYEVGRASARLAGRRLGNPRRLAAESKPAHGMAAYQVVIALLRSQRTDDAERVAVRSAEGLMALAGSDAPDAVSLVGSL